MWTLWNGSGGGHESLVAYPFGAPEGLLGFKPLFERKDHKFEFFLHHLLII
jgi:hypothetical protein